MHFYRHLLLSLALWPLVSPGQFGSVSNLLISGGFRPGYTVLEEPGIIRWNPDFAVHEMWSGTSWRPVGGFTTNESGDVWAFFIDFAAGVSNAFISQDMAAGFATTSALAAEASARIAQSNALAVRIPTNFGSGLSGNGLVMPLTVDFSGVLASSDAAYVKINPSANEQFINNNVVITGGPAGTARFTLSPTGVAESNAFRVLARGDPNNAVGIYLRSSSQRVFQVQADAAGGRATLDVGRGLPSTPDSNLVLRAYGNASVSGSLSVSGVITGDGSGLSNLPVSGDASGWSTFSAGQNVDMGVHSATGFNLAVNYGLGTIVSGSQTIDLLAGEFVGPFTFLVSPTIPGYVADASLAGAVGALVLTNFNWAAQQAQTNVNAGRKLATNVLAITLASLSSADTNSAEFAALPDNSIFRVASELYMKRSSRSGQALLGTWSFSPSSYVLFTEWAARFPVAGTVTQDQVGVVGETWYDATNIMVNVGDTNWFRTTGVLNPW